MKITTCPSCGSRKVKKVRGVLEVRGKKKNISVPDIEYHRCSQCEETFTDIENEKRIDAYLSRKGKHAA